MNVKNWILGIGIAIIFLMFGIYGTRVFMEQPDYNDFCKSEFARPRYLQDSECPTIDLPTSEQEKECFDKKGFIGYSYDAANCPTEWECDTCKAEYDVANQSYLKLVFIISVIGGLLIVVIGGLLLKFEPVGSGLMAGGMLFIISGSMRYWRYMDDILRFVILGIALAALIYLGYFINKKKKK